MSIENSVYASKQTIQIIRAISHYAREELRLIRRSQQACVLIFVLLSAIIVYEYFAAYTMFNYIAPTIGSTELSAWALAFIVPIAAIAFHLRISFDGGTNLERKLRIVVGLSLFLLVVGIASTFGLVIWEGASGLGNSNDGLTGVIGNDTIDLGGEPTSVYDAFFQKFIAPLPKIILFFGMAGSIIISVYCAHILIKMMTKRIHFFYGARKNAETVIEKVTAFMQGNREYKRLNQERIKLEKRVPPNLAYTFAHRLSSRVNERLAYMRKNLEKLHPYMSKQELADPHFSPKTPLPHHVTDLETGKHIIRDIRDAMRPHVIMTELGAFSPSKDI